MEILYFSEPTVEGGGVDKVAYYLTKALKKKASLTYLPAMRSNRDFVGIYLNNYKKFLRKEIDIIHFNILPTWVNGSSMFLRFAKLRQANTVINLHGIPELEQKAENWPESISFINWMNRLRYFKQADRVVVNSQYMRNNVLYLYELDPEKVVIIPNGVDLDLFSKNTEERITLDGDPSILYVGHFARLKGLDLLFQAIAKLKVELPKLKLHLVGRGSVEHYMHLAQKEGVSENVVFHDWADQSTVARYYRSADICVFPSRLEGFGLVVLEAMASGIPVIASNIPTFQEIILNNVDGCLFKSEDPDSLSNELHDLYFNVDLRKKLISNALEKVKSYSWEKIADRYVNLYNSLRN